MSHFDRSVFIGTEFSEKGRHRAGLITSILETFEIRSCFGNGLGGGGVVEGVRGIIESSWFVISLITRGARIGKNLFEPRPWLIQELIWGKACKKDCLVLVEEGVRIPNGILGDLEYLSFRAESFLEILPQFLRNLKILLNRYYLTLGVKDMPAVTHVSDGPDVGECSDEAKFLIVKVRHLAKQHRYAEALQYAMRATEVDPRYWRAWTSYGALLVQLGEVEKGDKIFARVLKDFNNNKAAKATALHNRAWVKEIKVGHSPSRKALLEQASLYSRALVLDHTRVYTRASLLIILVQLEEVERTNELLEESVMYENFIDALRFELDTRGVCLHSVLQSLPAWVRRMLYPPRLNGTNGYKY